VQIQCCSIVNYTGAVAVTLIYQRQLFGVQTQNQILNQFYELLSFCFLVKSTLSPFEVVSQETGFVLIAEYWTGLLDVGDSFDNAHFIVLWVLLIKSILVISHIERVGPLSVSFNTDFKW